MKVIIDNSEELTVTDRQADMLIEKQMIYECPECGGNICHTHLGVTINDVENAIIA
jgi:hypothetical protein